MSARNRTAGAHAAQAMTRPPNLPRQAGEATDLRRQAGGEDTRATVCPTWGKCRKEIRHDC